MIAPLVLCLPFSTDPGAPAAGEDETALVARVSEERLAATVRTLVEFGPRMGGTPSGHAAAAWRERTLIDLGLAVEVVEDGERWCHWVEPWTLRARVEGEEEWAELDGAWPYRFSPPGAGVLPLHLEPRAGAAWLSGDATRPRRGEAVPALVLHDGAGTPDGRYTKVLALRPGDSNPTPVFGVGTGHGARLRTWLEAERGIEVEFALASHNRRARARTVIATLPAREGAPGGHLLFCAHGDSDSGGPGANDNASGEAVVLEIARVWAHAVAEGRLPPPERAVRFALWGSEIHSTRAYLERHAEGDEAVLGVINFDQAGFGSAAQQLNVEPDDLEANAQLVGLVAALLNEHADTPGLPPRWATNKSLGGTDSYVFSGSPAFRRGGRPALTLFTSAWDEAEEHPRTPGMPGESWSDRGRVLVDGDPWYHSSGDLPEHTTDREPENMGWCARVGLLAGLRWLDGIE